MENAACILGPPLAMLANREPTQGMLLSDIKLTADITADEVGSSSRAVNWMDKDPGITCHNI